MQENSGFKFSDLICSILKRKALFIIVALIITIAGTSLGVLNNKQNPQYEAEFTNSFLQGEDTSLPNGIKLSYTDFVAEETIKALKSDATFNDVDIDKIIEDGDINITKNFDKDKNLTSFTITVSAKHFKDVSVARNFIKKLTIVLSNNVLDKKLVENSTDYDFSKNYSEAVSYEEKIQYLSSQKSLLSSQYAVLIENHGAHFFVNNRTLSHYKAEIDNFAKIKTLSEELDVKYFAPYDAELAATFETKIKVLQSRQQVLKDTLENIKNDVLSLAPNASISINDMSQIIEINKQIADMDHQISVLEMKMTSAKTENLKERDSFVESLDQSKLQLEEMTNTYYKTLESIYANALRVSFVNPSVVSTTGEVSIIVVSGVSLLVGIILSSFITYCAYAIEKKNSLSKEDKQENKQVA